MAEVVNNPCDGKHFVPAPAGYPILGIWVDIGKTVLYVKPGAKPGEHYQIVKAGARDRQSR